MSYQIVDNNDFDFSFISNGVEIKILKDEVESVKSEAESILIILTSGKTHTIINWQDETLLGAVSAENLRDLILAICEVSNHVEITESALPDNAATESTLADILTKIIAAPSTEAKQDVIISALATLNAKDFATQTTLSAFLTAYLLQNRPSQGTGRTYKTGQTAGATSTTTIYTVTNGKTLYVTSIVLSAYNSGAAGQLNIRDNTTVKIPFSIPAAGLGALTSLVPLRAVAITFPEPLQFTTNFNAEEAGGTLAFSVAFVGYEE